MGVGVGVPPPPPVGVGAPPPVGVGVGVRGLGLPPVGVRVGSGVGGSQETRTFFEAGSKMNNYVSTAPARTDRETDPPEKQTNSKKRRPVNHNTIKI